MGSKPEGDDPHSGDGATPGKIFVGGLHYDTTISTFNAHFGKYGEITDSVVIRDRYTGRSRGFGFITFADPSVVEKVMEAHHMINGKQVDIMRNLPRGQGQSKDFTSKKIFVGGIPSTVTEEELSSFFSKYGKVAKHQIIRDHETNCSRGFGFLTFESEEVVDEILSNGNIVDMLGIQVKIKKAEPKQASNLPPPSYGSKPRGGRSFNDEGYGGYGGPYGGFDGGFGTVPCRNAGVIGGRLGGGYGYSSGSGDFGGGYGGYANSSLGFFQGDYSLGYASHFGPYSGGFGGGYGSSGLRGYGPGYGGGYDSGPGSGYGGASGPYGRGGYAGSSRYHPYAR